MSLARVRCPVRYRQNGSSNDDQTATSLQTLVFLIMLAVTLFGTRPHRYCRVLGLHRHRGGSLSIIAHHSRCRSYAGTDAAGWPPCWLAFPAAVIFLHWGRGRLRPWAPPSQRQSPSSLEVVALVLFALAWIVLVWAMYVNRFFSSIPRIQSERGHTVISTGPYRFVRHPGYTAALLAAVTSGIGVGSWISTFIAPVALALLVWRTMIEDRMLQRDLPGYADYAARVRYRLVPGIW